VGSSVVLFDNETLANLMVAGIPAAARAVHNLSREMGFKPDQSCAIAVPGGWRPSQSCMNDWARLCPDLNIVAIDMADLPVAHHDVVYRGEHLASGALVVRQAWNLAAPTLFDRNYNEAVTILKNAGREIVAATGKPSDGIVSRNFNRPISQAITGAVLRCPGIRPAHGTLVAAALGIAMAVSLFLGDSVGLITGALLFQAASIVDGVDGEIARATYRTSKRGASLDTLTDGATNLAFIAGVSFNLWKQGHSIGAQAGALGLLMLAFGLTLLAAHSRRTGGSYSFDALKMHFQAAGSPVKRLLTRCVTRDCYAAVLAVLIVANLAEVAMVLFAGVVSAWVATTMVVLSRLREARLAAS